MRLTTHLYLVPLFTKECRYICPPTLCRQDVSRDDDNSTRTFTDYRVIHKVNVRSQPIKRVGQKMSLKTRTLVLYFHLYYAQFIPEFTAILRQYLSYITAPSTVYLSHRQQSSTGTYRDGSGAQDRDKKNALCFSTHSPQGVAFILPCDEHFLFPVDISLCPVLSAILSVLSLPSDSL